MEKVFIVLALLGVVTRLLHWPGSEVYILLSILGLTILYFNFGFLLYNGIRLRNIFKRASYQHTPVSNILLAIATGVVHTTMLISIVFKIQHWPGGNEMLYGGCTACCLLAPAAFLFNRGKQTVLFKNMVRRSAAVFAFTLLIAFWPHVLG